MDELVVSGRLIRLVTGDITQAPVDAIVNAANSQLAGGGGVDGAIHRAGGPDVMAELDRLKDRYCPTGSAVRTGAGKLSAKWVIHAVGPRWKGGAAGEAAQLAAAYQTSLKLAEEAGAKTVAFPSISTGVYGYPVDRAALVALPTVAAFLKEDARSVTLALFVLFDAHTHAAYAKVLEALDPRA